VSTLDQAEEAMLELTCQRAEIVDGMEILELGCGWGSLCLWMAEQYPAAQIVAVSNSATQKAYIDAQCATRQLDNVDVITANVADLRLERRFDRVVSIEMFEHLKNYGAMMARIAEMLRPDGRLFVHIFCHREFAYEFEADDPGDWMARTFFSGGTMPSSDLLLYFQDDLRLVDQWAVDGRHYARTLRAWLNKLDAHRQEVDEIMAATYGPDQATRQVVNWRLFFMVCEAIFRSRGGREWFVAHYLFAKS
jgi:cyclopropane-fatty-acyl-phospholipid synthase